MSGGGISSGSIHGNRLVGNTITTAYTSSGINTSLGRADFANGVFSGYNTASYVSCNRLQVNGTYFRAVTLYYDSGGVGTHITVLAAG